MDRTASLIDQATRTLEQHGIDVGDPEQVVHRQDDSDRPKAVYTHRFDRLDIYNAGADEEEAQIQVEHELLHRYQHIRYGEQQGGTTGPASGMELQRPSSVDRDSMGPDRKPEQTGPQPVENTEQVIETLGEAFALIYTAFRHDELDEETVDEYVTTLRERGDYKGRKIAAMLDELWQRFTAMDGEDETNMETFLTTIQDEYMG